MTEVFSDYLDQQKARIGQVIDTSLGQFKAEDWEIVVMMGQDRYKSLFDEHWDIITDYPSRRGKYLRPALVMLMAEAMSGSSEKAVFTATAMQMIIWPYLKITVYWTCYPNIRFVIFVYYIVVCVFSIVYF